MLVVSLASVAAAVEDRAACGATTTANGTISCNSTKGPRGDDERPRNWGKSNDRASVARLPPTVAFLGKSANVRVYPNFSDPSVYLQLRFGKVQETDASGRPIPNHGIPSLADASDATTFSTGNMTVKGVNMSYVTVLLNPVARNSFRPTVCKPPSNGTEDDDEGSSQPPSPSPVAGGGRRLLQSSPPPPQLNLTLLFGFDDALTFPYGDVNITVPRNGLKWTVSYKNWPFCNDTNKLAVSLSLTLANNASASVTSNKAASGAQELTVQLGSSYNATLALLNYALDSPNGALRMPVGINVTNGGANGNASSSVTSVTMYLPNPRSANATGVWYDPTQITTNAYLASTDPGNTPATGTIVASVTSAPGAAAGLRTTMWAAAGAVLLSAFLSSGRSPL
ncbi:hypothetical protein GPECTOR_13g686 [Gonium pectorale]|uniref:Uncharacterized protein n=1 Tax=Gonium pectorale TaxID=33097 RepID=A0A150GMZ7_GONPE|nr:hypothetical protein GPECTOR_13g686 [Gonium pectorale]|eukprot:KXZ51199.1 hypothetical protein GPECTOR_13g686 [Gonium pectorale]